MSRKFDAIVIGTGQSGKPLALALANEGWKVAVIEKRFVGGTCINYGCTPTKTMIACARIAYLTERGKEFGINTGKVKVDMAKIVKRKNKIVKEFRESGEHSLEKNENIKLFFGEGRFISKNEVEIISNDSKPISVTSDYVFIDTGTIPMIPTVKGLEDAEYLTSETIMDLKKVPRHLIIMGGSYIGVEFGQMFRRFGSDVTIIERSCNLLSREDDDVSSEMKKILIGEGIKVYTSSETVEVKKGIYDEFTLKIKSNGSTKTIRGTHLLVATGTKPDTSRLGLENAAVKVNERGFIQVNDKLETNVKGVYAMGDVKGGPAFTHLSYDDYRVIYSNLIKKENRTTKDRYVPYTVFTDPQLGRIGLSEEDAKAKKLDYKIVTLNMEKVARAIETGETKGFMKVIVDSKTRKILGAAVLGIEGGEVMSMIQIAMMGNLSYDKLRDGIFSHPSLSESLNNLFIKLEN